MAKMNVWKRMFPVRTHEGALAQKVDAKSELRRTVLTCLLWEDTFYEKGNDIAKRIAALAAENKPEVVAALAREARGKMQLRHAPLFLVRESAVKLRDVLFLCHAKPQDEAQAALWKKLVENTLESTDTWEVALSAGKDKRENFERLLREGKLGGMAVLRNLRLMLASGVDPKLIRERLDKDVARALPFRFVTAARHAPKLEDALEKAMLKGIAGFEQLAGSTGLVVDVSGSMNYKLSKMGETTRMDAAAGLAILLREKAEDFSIATFSDACVELPPQRGFALRDAIVGSQAHSGTYLKRALTQLHEKAEWRELNRLIVITDEQSHDGILRAWTPRAYVVNVAPYKHGISYGNGWTHLDGWSERIVDYVAAVEAEAAA